MEIEWRIKQFNSLSLQELYDIMNLRQEVFIVEQNAPYIDADYKDQKAWHVMAYSNDKLVAYARIIEAGISYDEPSIGRVVNSPIFRKTGLGRLLMDKSIEVMEQKYQTSKCRISAQTYLVPFYSTYGFKVCSEEYLEDGLPHYQMVRA